MALQVKVADPPGSLTDITEGVTDARPNRKKNDNVDISMGTQMMVMELGNLKVKQRK